MVNNNLSHNIFNQNFDDPLMNYSLKSIISPVVKKKSMIFLIKFHDFVFKHKKFHRNNI